MSFFEDASLVLIPSAQKTSKVYSIKPTDGTGDLTFTRSNDTATRVNSAGLIEKVRTNLSLYSEQFDNAYWTKSGGTITANATTAPDGTLTAEKFIEGSGSVTPECSRTPIATGNGIFTLSVFAKASERNFLIINNNSGISSNRTWFNLTTGVIGTTAAASTAYIENVGNGWYRCSVSNAITNFGSSTSAFQIGSADGVQTYTGDGTSGIFIWGAQMELSDFGATDYIVTTSAAVSVGPVANVPRLDYLGSSCPRLLLEPQRQNVITFSEQMDNAAWLKLGITVSANNTISPSGYVDADKLIADAGTGNRVVYQSVVPAGVSTVSTYAKAGEFGGIVIANGTQGAFFNLITGAYRTFYVSAPVAYSITSVGNGWYRCSVTFNSASTDNLYIGPNDNVSTTLAITGNGTSGIYIWGAQLEAGAYATSYIPTLGAAVTRGADAASKTGISSLIGQTEGTLFCEISGESLEESGRYMSIGVTGDGTNRLVVYQSNNVINVYCGVGATFNFTYNPPAGPLKIAVAYKSGDYAFYVNGVQAAVSTLSGVPLCSEFNLGRNEITTAELPPSVGYSQALLFKTRLTNAQLAELTTL